jgi:hypothetical protein
MRARPRPVRCAICRGDAKLIHFSLLVLLVGGGSHTTRGAGSIDLCEPCWRKATAEGAIRRRPGRKP